MELRQIKHFMAVAETGSFTKASERVSISQPAMSASIAKLESELQVKLLDRSRTKIVPTPAGMRLKDRANAILSACSSIKAELRSVATPQPLRIGVLKTLATRPIANLISGYRCLVPGASFILVDGPAEDLRKRLSEKRVDAIITRLEGEAPEFRTRELFREKFVLAAPMDHRFAKEQSVRLSALDGEPYISRTACETFQATTKVLTERSIKFRVTYRTDQDDRALSLVAAGVGLTMLPELFRAPGIQHVQLSDFEIERTIAIQWHEDAEVPQLSQFIKIAASHDWQAA
ncbi:DNA-binding transcriptional LysR family regulator [Panacagrimonas perspica]|uniref:DNA-binding transcriptional LysR family regulator n=1 Tax=Panacagrimonas perspica TaxID=381431 RepID=A0A4R7P5Z0_9GAMM|nr:LysR family transcriptional regulator [Panacagrimonas perspica]TDU28892.1 DNA-binding transcriptional LysR family regulator [Panacagrimonas perspica]THD02281.1 hypothetical protein B1810_15245 [Panacagrimonas perspica]